MVRKLLACVFVFLVAVSFFGCGSSANHSNAEPREIQTDNKQIYKLEIVPILKQIVKASENSTIAITNNDCPLSGVKISIASGALQKDMRISVSYVNGPPPLPMGLNHVGVPIDFGPNGTEFQKPAMLEIPYTEKDKESAGILSDDLKLFSYEESSRIWTEEKIISIDTSKHVVKAEVKHFSIYSLVGFSGSPPQNRGFPKPADVLFFMTAIDGVVLGWMPGHAALYVGTLSWNGSEPNFADEAVKRSNRFNVIHAVPEKGVKMSYFRIPNTPSENDPDADPLPLGYVGAYEAKIQLTPQQRANVVACALVLIGRPYAKTELLGNIFISTDGIKGPNFICTGLIEFCYEFAKYRDGIGLMYDEGSILSPVSLCRSMVIAGGREIAPTILWTSFSPNKGTSSTEVFVQVAVYHPLGLSYIQSVKCMNDDGLVNSDVDINDRGISGDLIAGDGVYSVKSRAGGDASKGSAGITFFVTDKDGKVDSVRLVYTYISNYAEVVP